MKNITREDICCVSCKFGCQLTGEATDLLNRCPLQKIAVWPGRNYFMTKGVLSIVSGQYESVFCRGCVFVDFSARNLRYFTNRNWIDYLRLTKLNIILICDTPMEALALYWKREDQAISTVITGQESLEEIKKSINYSYYGIKGGGKYKGNPLSKDEVRFLDLVVNDRSLISISRELMVEVKKIYNMKDSIRRKTGLSLNKLLSR
ncbi:LuxR family transcriptional regulator [Erwiniaceae bacterium L1_54_6]|jgi:hypothetical protein|nr:LuxR family transcriptional regulator [Erwiniaceae bacterium L1_54_6]